MSKLIYKNNFNNVIFFLSTTCLSALFLTAPGTNDMQEWDWYIKMIDRFGFVLGFDVINDVQPPLCSVFLSIISSLAKILNLSDFYAIKLSVILFLFASTVMILRWSKSFVIAGFFQLLLTINVGFGYLDIFYTPFLLGAIFALEREKYALAIFYYTISALIKSQPLLLAPFILLYIWFRRPTTSKIQMVKWYIGKFLPAFLLIIMPIILIYNKTLIHFLVNAQHGTLISANALNLGWVMTYGIRKLHLFGQELIGWGINQYIPIPTIPVLPVILKGLFFIAYGFTLYRFYTSKSKTITELLKYMSAAFFSYFALNSSVHENHLFIFMVLCVLLYHKGVVSNIELSLAAIYGNLNLVLFYGIDGHGLPFDRGIYPLIDISIIFSFLLLCFFTTYYCKINSIDFNGIFLRFRDRKPEG